MKINNALDWAAVETEFNSHIRMLTVYEHVSQTKKILANITEMVKTLSKYELEARITGSTTLRRVKEQLITINDAIMQLEQWIMILVLT